MDYSKLAGYYDELEGTSKRLEKTYIVAKILKEAIKEKNPEPLINLVRGKVFPAWDERNIGVSDKLVIKALATSTGNSADKIVKLFSRLGDLGLVASELTKDKKQTTLHSKKLTVEMVYKNIQSLAGLGGEGTVSKKVSLMSELLTSASPVEAKYIVRLILEQMRIGIAESTLRDSIVWCFFCDKLKLNYVKETNELVLPDNNRKEYDSFVEKIQHGYDITNDYAEVFRIVKEEGIKGLEKVSLKSGKPINIMLFQKAKDIEEAFEIVGKAAAFEFKYDGFRLQIHNHDGKITLYTRRLENVTKQFPDVVEAIKKGVKGENFILDSEVIGIDPKTKSWLPFQSISQRIRRKYDIEKLVKEVPVMVNVFDIMSYNNENLLNTPFVRRRHLIEKIVFKIPEKLQPAKQIVTDKIEEARKFYEEALSLGNEGIMAKNLSSEYKPGSRVGYGIKIKPVLETLDLVVIKADYGEGKRAGWLTSYTIACYDNKKENLLEIGKVSTGLKEKEQEEGITYLEITKMLKPLIEKNNGKEVFVKPKVVIEVAYEEIQVSQEYNSGYALRFPRFLRLREDKLLKDINTLKEVEKIYDMQRGRNNN
ncbi:MAG TPA: ATP-dependent DNA ligase [Candidatus Nanoarchaeia archaeon]|nr:ATP-dependent DNA ligase [Candidatus Nanoarchaeia archaeon]